MMMLLQKFNLALLEGAVPAIKGRSWFLAVCFGCCVCVGLSGALQAQGKTDLSPDDAPWLDSKAGEVLPIDFGDRQSARSASRAEVPMATAVTPVPAPRPATFWNWNGDWVWNFFKFVFYIFLVLAIGIGAYLGYRYFYRWRKLSIEGGDDESLAKRTVEQSMRELSFDVDFSGGDFCAEAEKAYRSGDLRSAIIYLFSYVLVSLDQKGHIRLRKGKTNREYLREIRGQTGLAKFYQRVMVPFEETFFGDYQLDQKEFESCWSQLGQFQKDVVQTSRVTHG